jgi:phosphoribosylamine--glycine ligase
MKILVIGSGGREHALVWKIAQSSLVEKIYCAPGNPGIAQLAENVPISGSDHQQLLKFTNDNSVDLTVVGPEDPLVEGIVDTFTNYGLKIFGPTKAAAQLEGSKAFSKNIMKKYSIPTADFKTYNNFDRAKDHINKINHFPVVVKASGLAAGKGVLICQDYDMACDSLTAIMKEKIFSEAGNQVVIEEYLEGDEVSIFALVDGKNYKLLSASQDHKKIFDGDQGKNTGGMGAYAPTPVANNALITEIEGSIIRPTINAMQKEGIPYKGLLYFGIIVTGDGPKVLEYNCRFGDPETEVVLPLLKSDLVPLMIATINGTIDKESIELNPGYAIDVVLSSGGYPDSYEKGKLITGLDSVGQNIIVFHAGTKAKDNQILTNGGRVLNIVAVGDDFIKTREFLYNSIKKIDFEEMHYRKDIGSRALKYF